jgi:hypothetical protein
MYIYLFFIFEIDFLWCENYEITNLINKGMYTLVKLYRTAFSYNPVNLISRMLKISSNFSYITGINRTLIVLEVEKY